MAPEHVHEGCGHSCSCEMPSGHLCVGDALLAIGYSVENIPALSRVWADRWPGRPERFHGHDSDAEYAATFGPDQRGGPTVAIKLDYLYSVGDRVRVAGDPRDATVTMAAPLGSLDYDHNRKREGTAYYSVRFDPVRELAGRHYFGEASESVHPEAALRRA